MAVDQKTKDFLTRVVLPALVVAGGAIAALVLAINVFIADEPPPPPPPVDPPVVVDPVPLDEHLAAKALAPADKATLFVPAGEVRELSGENTHVGVRVEGTLRLLPGCTLRVETLSIWHGRLEIGTPENPIPLSNPVEIILRGPLTDPFQLGRGIILHGPTRIYGQIPTTKAVDLVPLESLVGKTDEQIRATFEAVASAQVRAITIRSEDPNARGHVMALHTNDFIIEGVAFLDLGRTRKDIPVTDSPDLTNKRGRYPFHAHHGGVVRGGTVGKIRGCYVARSPGLGIVIHDSQAEVVDNVTYDIFGSHLFGEAGSEIGLFSGNLCVKSTGANPLDKSIADDRGIFDFGWQGHGIWTHGGGIVIEGNVLSGHPGGDIAIVSRPGEKDAVFQVANLRPDDLAKIDATRWLGGTQVKDAQGRSVDMAVEDTPFLMRGNVCLSKLSTELYEIHNPHYHNARSLIDGGEYHGRLNLGYVGNITLRNTKHIGTGLPGSYAIKHTERNFNMRYEGIDVSGFEYGLMTTNEHTCDIIGGKFDCRIGFLIEQKFSRDDPRFLRFDGKQEFGPATEFGYCKTLEGAGSWRWNLGGLIRSSMSPAEWLLLFENPHDQYWNQPFMRDDTTTVADDYLSYEELGDDFRWDFPGLPEFLRKTNKELRAMGLYVGGQVLPKDAAKRKGHRGLFHRDPATFIPRLTVLSPHETTEEAYTLVVLDDGENRIEKQETLKVGWNVLEVTADGINRGILVRRK